MILCCLSRRAGFACLGLVLLLLVLSFAPVRNTTLALWDAFYRSGALVFGGGHVVLPLLRDAVVVPGRVSDNTFLAGYGAAQAVPGPLFTFAAYLGAVADAGPGRRSGRHGRTGGDLPAGNVALLGTLPFWHALRTGQGAQAAMRGINAAVVGLLGMALDSPVWTSAVQSGTDFAVAVTGFVLLIVWRAPPLVVVVLSAAAGAGLALM